MNICNIQTRKNAEKRPKKELLENSLYFWISILFILHILIHHLPRGCVNSRISSIYLIPQIFSLLYSSFCMWSVVSGLSPSVPSCLSSYVLCCALIAQLRIPYFPSLSLIFWFLLLKLIISISVCSSCGIRPTMITLSGSNLRTIS